MNLKKGFTIIELIVVVAIIAILAAIVLTSVTQYINKSKDAAIKAGLDQFYVQEVKDFESLGYYVVAPGADALLAKIYQNIQNNSPQGGGGITTAFGTDYWCFVATLYSGKTYCVDYKGYRKETTTPTDLRCDNVIKACTD